MRMSSVGRWLITVWLEESAGGMTGEGRVLKGQSLFGRDFEGFESRVVGCRIRLAGVDIVGQYHGLEDTFEVQGAQDGEDVLLRGVGDEGPPRARVRGRGRGPSPGPHGR